jgi:hypothetical protein
MNRHFPKGLALNNVEYICLKMFLNPGQSQRFYRRAVATYRQGVRRTTDHHRWIGHGAYFRRGSRYRDVLWEDRAKADVPDHMPFPGNRRVMKPAVSQMHLTRRGIEVAVQAAAKVGLGNFEVVETPVSKVMPGDFGGIPISPGAEALANPIGFCRRAN